MLTGVPNGNYEIRLMNTTFVRGRPIFCLKETSLLPDGGDLTAALDALTSGQVLILTTAQNMA